MNDLDKLLFIAKSFATESVPSTKFIVRQHTRINRNNQTQSAVKPYKKRKFSPMATQGAK